MAISMGFSWMLVLLEAVPSGYIRVSDVGCREFSSSPWNRLPSASYGETSGVLLMSRMGQPHTMPTSSCPSPQHPGHHVDPAQALPFLIAECSAHARLQTPAVHPAVLLGQRAELAGCCSMGPLNSQRFWDVGARGLKASPAPVLAWLENSMLAASTAERPSASPTWPWLVVQLNPRFLASRLQSKPLRCRIRAASAEGSESSCRSMGKARHWAATAQGSPVLMQHRATTHFCLQRPQVEDVEVAGEGCGEGCERAQGRQGRLLSHWQDQGLGIQMHGGEVAQQRGEADRAAVLYLQEAQSALAVRLQCRGHGASSSLENRHQAPGPPAMRSLSLLVTQMATGRAA